MTEGDGDAEPLRVPPWLPDGEPAGHHAAPDPIEPVSAPVPWDHSYLERHAPLPPDDVPPADRRRRWILAGGIAVVLLLLPTLLIVSLDNKGPAGHRQGGVPSFADVSLPGPTSDAPSPSGQSPSPPGSPSGAGSSSQAGVPPVTATGTPPPVRFGPVTIEAEAPGNALHGSAWVTDYPGASGGSIVRNIGNWGDRRGPGILLFQNVTVPVVGTYTLKFFFVDIDNEAARTAVITVLGGASQSIAVQGSSTCCAAASVRVTLQQGTNIVTFGNENGHAPSIDRIVLSLP